MIFLTGLFLTTGCESHNEAVDSQDTAEENGLLRLGEIHGVVTRSVDVQEDGQGALSVVAFYNTLPSMEARPMKVLVKLADMSSTSAEISYSLTYFFPDPAPYYLIAKFHDSLNQEHGLDFAQGDLISNHWGAEDSEPIMITSGAVIQHDIDLSYVYDE